MAVFDVILFLIVVLFAALGVRRGLVLTVCGLSLIHISPSCPPTCGYSTMRPWWTPGWCTSGDRT